MFVSKFFSASGEGKGVGVVRVLVFDCSPAPLAPSGVLRAAHALVVLKASAASINAVPNFVRTIFRSRSVSDLSLCAKVQQGVSLRQLHGRRANRAPVKQAENCPQGSDSADALMFARVILTKRRGILSARRLRLNRRAIFG
jgi:hypothetical protein